MKRKFTKLMAALALLVFITPPLVGWGQAPVNTTLWEETWTGGTANETPSSYGFEGTTVYGGVTLTYAQSSTNTKLYNEELAGGTSPELLLSKSNQTWTISNIPTGQATGMSLTFLSNKTTFAVTTTTNGVTVSGSQKSWTITVTGNVTSFDLTIKNTGSNNARLDNIQLVVTTAGAGSSTVATPIFDPNGGRFLDSQEVNISCGTEGATIHYSTISDEGPWTDYSDALTFTETTTLYAYATKADMDDSEVNSATFTKVTPMNVAEARELIDALNGGTSEEVYVTGVVSGIVEEYSSQYSNVSFNMSDDGTTTSDQLEAFRCTGTYAATVGTGDEVVVRGTLKLYNNSVYEFNAGCEIVSLTPSTNPSISAEDVNIANDATNGSIAYTVNNPVDGGSMSAVTASEWLTLGNNFNSPIAFTCTANSETTARTATVTLTYTYGDNQTTTKDVTVTQAAYQAPNVTWDLTTNSYDPDPTEELIQWSSAYATMKNERNGSGNTAVNNYIPTTRTSTRFYAGNKLTLTPAADYAITSVVFEATTTGYASALQTSTWTNANASADGTTVTVTPTTGTQAISAVIGGTCGFTSVTVYYEEDNSPTITADDVEIAYDAEEGAIAYTINNPVEGGSITASCDAEWIEVDETPKAASTGSFEFICSPNSNFYAHNATITLTYTYGNSKATITKDVTVTQAGDPNANGLTPENPIMVAEAIYAIDEVGNVSNIYVGGIVSEIVTEYSSQYHNITFDMIDEEGNEYFLRAYHCGGELAADVQAGDEVVVYGTLTLYTSNNGSIYEFASGCQLVSLTHPQSTEPSITVEPDNVSAPAQPLAGEDWIEGTLDITYANLTITDMSDFAIQFYDENNTELNGENKPNWIEVDVAEQDPSVGEGYVVSYLVGENEGEARSAYFKVYAMAPEGSSVDYIYSNLVTITQAAPVVTTTGNTYELFTGNLVEGDYLIYYEGKVMTNVVSDARLQYVEATPNTNNNVIVLNNDAAIWHIAPSGDYWTIYSAEAEAFAASTGAKNKAQMLADGTDDKALWTVSGTDTYEFVNKKNTANNVNANLRNNNTYGFACYSTSTGGALSLYKRTNTVTEIPTLQVSAYEGVGGYVLVASPVSTTPGAAGMITDNGEDETNTYDLYYFDQNANDGLEWRNYRATSFSLVPGHGYLYASKNGVNLSFYGTPYAGTGEVELVAGWNLIGNPYANAAILKDASNVNQAFYTLNGPGSELAAGTPGATIAAMEGVFVEAAAAGEVVTFVEQQPASPTSGNSNYISINVSRNRGGLIDRALVGIGEGPMLHKFQLNPNHTKVYITEGNQDYAIVRSANQGELPVNFKAEENGSYTLSVNPENVEMTYLHLIDNMTGADVDLLAIPSYTFDARTTDYASRFRLVFNANDANGASTGSATFAYFDGSSWQVSNTGEATLQVVDVLGRIVNSQTINGNASINVSERTGVYMLRLVNGENVKVQKIVIK